MFKKAPAFKSLSDILAGFTAVLDDLELLTLRNSTEIESNEEQIASLAADNRALKAENERAAAIAEKLRCLIN